MTIQAANLFGLYAPAGTAVDLRVDPPLFQQPIFYLPLSALAFVALLLAVALIVRQRRYQRTLAEREQRLALISRVTRDAVWDWKLEGDRCVWGEGLQASFGYAPSEIGDAVDWWRVRVHPDDLAAVLASLDAALGGDAKVWSADYRFRRQDGHYAQVFDRGYIMRGVGGRPYRLIGAMMDVTERHELREQVRHAQKLESVGRLAGGIAHEFNNLLTVIIGNTELLLAGLPAADPNRAEVEEVRVAADRAARLTSQMLGFARRQIIRPTLLNLNHLILDVETMLSGGVGEDVQIATNPAVDLGLVRVDAAQVEQLIVHLVLNARDAMPSGGHLTISTRNVEVEEQDAPGEAGPEPGRYVLLSVADTGVGMDEATLEHLFEPFFTTKPPGQGSGLGLATCYGIAKQNGGHVTVESRPGHGARVDVYLPRVDQSGEPAADRARPEDGRKGRGEALLVVEDESALRRLMVRTLRGAGYDVIEAASGPDALQVVARFRTSVALLVTDVVMPHMSGVELAADLRARWPSLRVLFTSGYAERVQSQLPQTPDDRFLPKPFTPAALRKQVEELLAAAR